ncbi:hypothetical protein Efla_003055 [Eimeria flavescens]
MQVEFLREHFLGRKLFVEARGEAEEAHRWRAQATDVGAHGRSLSAEMRTLELRIADLQATNRLMEAELDKLRRQQQGWLQERSQHEETTLKLHAAEAEAARMPFLEQLIFELRGDTEALEQAQRKEAEARSEVAHRQASIREAKGNGVIGALKADLVPLKVVAAQDEVSSMHLNASRSPTLHVKPPRLKPVSSSSPSAHSYIGGFGIIPGGGFALRQDRIVGPRLRGLYRRPPCRRSSHRTASVAAFACITAVLFLISLCRVVRNNRTEFRVASRKLSDNGNQTDSNQSLVSCSDAEQESVESTSGEPPSPSSQAPQTFPQAEEVRMRALATPEGTSFSVGEDASGMDTGDQPSTSTGRGHKRLAGWRGSNLPPKKRKYPAFSDQHQASRSEAELTAAQGLLDLRKLIRPEYGTPKFAELPRDADLSLTEASPGTPSTQVLSPTLTQTPLSSKEPSQTSPHQLSLVRHNPSASPGLAGPSTVGASLGAGHQTSPALRESPSIPRNKKHPADNAGQEGHPATERDLRDDYSTTSGGEQASTDKDVLLHPEGVSASPEGFAAPAPEEQPSTSSAVSMPADSKPSSGHPFYRTPMVKPADQGVLRFHSNLQVPTSRFYPLMNEARALLVLPSLSSEQLDQLALVMQQLVSYGYHYERRSMSGERRGRVCQVFARRYFLLDTVLAGLSVLGESASGPWWEAFAGAVSHEADERQGGSRMKFLPVSRNRDLANRLGEALEILKAGKRLFAEETVNLKRELLFPPAAPRGFSRRRWDAWRKDDGDYRSTSANQHLL